VKETSWDTIIKALTSRTDLLGMEDGSHKLILISPSPKDRSIPLPSIITKTVGVLLCERDADHQWERSRQLYKTLRIDPETRATSGKLIEPAFHVRCTKGGAFQLYEMTKKPGGRTLIQKSLARKSYHYHLRSASYLTKRIQSRSSQKTNTTSQGLGLSPHSRTIRNWKVLSPRGLLADFDNNNKQS
jgi:hypothetical protein